MVSIYTYIFNYVPNIIYFEWLPHTYQLPYLVVETLAIKHAKMFNYCTHRLLLLGCTYWHTHSTTFCMSRTCLPLAQIIYNTMDQYIIFTTTLMSFINRHILTLTIATYNCDSQSTKGTEQSYRN